MDKFIIMNAHDATLTLNFKHGSLKFSSLFCYTFVFKYLEMNLKVSFLKN